MKKTVAMLLAVAALGLALTLPPTVEAKNCGTYLGSKLVTYGGVTCKTAKKVYYRYKNNLSLPDPWWCAASARVCKKGNSNKRFTFGYN